MSSLQALKGATLRTPKRFEKVLGVYWGAGYDRHGQNATDAALEAIKQATSNVTMPGVVNFVPGGFEKLKVRVKVGVPAPESVDKEKLKAAILYAAPENVGIKVIKGGMRWHSGVVFPNLGDAPGGKRDGQQIDEDPDSSDDEDQLAGKVTAQDDVFAAVAAIRLGY